MDGFAGKSQAIEWRQGFDELNEAGKCKRGVVLLSWLWWLQFVNTNVNLLLDIISFILVKENNELTCEG